MGKGAPGRNEMLEDLYLYLAHASSQYPSGVPTRFITTELPAATSGPELLMAGGADARVVLLCSEAEPEADDTGVPFTSEIWNLYSNIVTKGLGVPIEEVLAVNVLSISEAEAVEALLESAQPRVTVVLGKRSFELLRGRAVFCDEEFSTVRGTWHRGHSSVTLVTHGLREVLDSKSIKKEFWRDLQEVLARGFGGE